MPVYYISPNHYFLQQSEHIDVLLSPLKNLGVSYYTYMRKYLDGTQIYLANTAQWIEDYYNLSLYQSSDFELNPTKYEDTLVAWNATCDLDRKVFVHGREKFDSANGLTIIKKYPDSCEFHFFSTSINNREIYNLYANHVDLFHTFIDYFKDNAQIILEKSKKHAILIPDLQVKIADSTSCMSDTYKSLREDFFAEIKQIDPKSLRRLSPYKGEIRNIKFTKREQECIQLLIAGKSAKQTASILELSTRTVESYINNIKDKLHCRTKTGLVSAIIKLSDQL